MDDNEGTVQRIHQIFLVIEQMGQELQEAREESQRLREALEPFAKLNQTIEKHGTIAPDWVPWWGDLMRADEVLKGTDND